VLTVSVDEDEVESQLAAGVLSCPCGGVLAPWGHARARVVIDAEELVRWRPRRGRCRSCQATHVLLPAGLLVRRAYSAAVIGGVLAACSAGVAQRRVARQAGLARSTVRGWVARLRVVAEVLRGHFIAWLVWLDASSSRLDATGHGAAADAIAAIAAAARQARGRLGIAGVWTFASAATGGRLLANTSAPFPAPWTG
jgi:hypothetical protein